MTLREKLAAGLSLVALAVGVGWIAPAFKPIGSGFAASSDVASAHHRGGRWFGRHRSGMHPSLDRHFCNLETWHAGLVTGLAAYELKLTLNQRRLLDAVITAAERAVVANPALCTEGNLDDLPVAGRIAKFSNELRSAASVFESISAPMTAFHAALDEDQRAHLEAMMLRRQSGRH